MEDDFMKKGSILACSITCAMVVGGVIALGKYLLSDNSPETITEG